MFTIDDDLQGLLQLLVRGLELVVLMGSPQRAGVHQVEGDLDGDTLVVGHEIPVLLDLLEHI